MKLGILGTGMIVQDLLTTLDRLPLTSFSLLGTPHSKEKTESLAARYNAAAVFYDYQEMLESDIDTVYVALPNHLHFSFASQALEQGKHVIIEKPITTSLHELNALKRLAAENNCILLEAMNIHFLPAYQAIQSELAKIGRIRMVSLNYSQYSSRYNDFLKGIIHPAFDADKAGGALMDLNVYNIHFISGLFGQPDNVNYYANIQNNIDTSGVLVADYGDFKCVCIGAKDCKAPTTSLIQGEKGSIQIAFPVNQMTGFSLQLNNGDSLNLNFDRRDHRLYDEFQAFIRIIDNRDLDEAARLMAITTTASDIIQLSKHSAGMVAADR